jgi:hypothetical protein
VQTKEISMNIKAIITMLAVAGLAFAAGVCCVDASRAVAGPPEDVQLPPEAQAMMEAWEKAGAVGAHHEKLNGLAGEWHGTFRMWMEDGAEPMESTGTIDRRWVLNGRFLEEKVTATSTFGDFNGIGYLGYNNLDGRYEFVWLEDMSTGMMHGTGTFDPDNNTFRWSSSHRDPITGHTIDSWSKLEMTSSSSQTYTGWQIGKDGRKFKSFEGTLERK